MSMTTRYPEVHDMVEVIYKHVPYYGYVVDIDFDMRCPTMLVEFFPGCSMNFDFADCKLMEYPEPEYPEPEYL